MAAIRITDSDSSNGNLTLSDNGNTDASRGEIITWIIGPHSGVKSITAITVKTGSANVFDPDPAKLGGSENWQGTVKKVLDIPSYEDYNIYWDDSTGTNHCFDPRISVNN